MEMALGPIARQEAENERLLRGLERQYDKPGEHYRHLNRDLAAIKKLLERGVIDRAHAEQFKEAAKLKFEEARKKYREPWERAKEKRIDALNKRILYCYFVAVVVVTILSLNHCYG
jgi:hypothetical protein